MEREGENVRKERGNEERTYLYRHAPRMSLVLYPIPLYRNLEWGALSHFIYINNNIKY